MYFKIHRETNKVLKNNRYMPDFYICSDKAGCQNHLSGCKDILAGAKGRMDAPARAFKSEVLAGQAKYMKRAYGSLELVMASFFN